MAKQMASEEVSGFWIRSGAAFGRYGTFFEEPPTSPTATAQHRTHAHVSGRELETLPSDSTWRRVTW